MYQYLLPSFLMILCAFHFIFAFTMISELFLSYTLPFRPDVRSGLIRVVVWFDAPDNAIHRNTVERRLSERQSSETSNTRTHIFFVLCSNNEESAITSRIKVLFHFY